MGAVVEKVQVGAISARARSQSGAGSIGARSMIKIMLSLSD
jgi:hypothetical protein